ncbi:MAG TPA: calcium-binding protein, partial [Methylophilaceae bacterium]
ISSVDYTLSDNVEQLTLATGFTNINATGNDEANRIVGNSGNNILDGKGGSDDLVGGLGNDTYVVDVGTDRITENANEGTDTVLSSVSWTLGNNLENLTLTGTDSTNATGNSVNNILIGNAGDNTLDGAQGADTMKGGAGDDIYFVDNAGDVVTENANEGTDTIYSSVNRSTLEANVENLSLFGAATTGVGNSLDNILIGNDNNNTLTDALGGNDYLNGGLGVDTMAGGAGDDIYVVDNAGDIVTETSGNGNDTILSSITYSLIDTDGVGTNGGNVENLTLTGTAAINATGNALANILTGNSANNTLTDASGGNDTLDGGAGADTMSGGAGNDTYVVDNVGDIVSETSGNGNDTVLSSITYSLVDTDGAGTNGGNVENLTLTGFASINATGNALNNIITGNSGDNTLTGGAGNDTYVLAADFGHDLIIDTDATGGNIDTISFAAGINPSDVSVTRNGQDLLLTVGTNVATVQNWFLSNTNKIEQIQFSDTGNTLWDVAAITSFLNSLPTGTVTVAGTATQNQVLTASNTLADTDGLGTITYQWQSSPDGNAWANISGATASTFTLADAQVGKLVRAVASYTDGHGNPESVPSTATTAIVNVNDTPTGSIAVSGTVTQNQVLTANSTLADGDGLGALIYQWQSSPDGTTWTDISGATAATFTLTETQVGKQIRVNASYTDGHGTAESATSTATAMVANVNDTPTGSVAFSGVAVQNQVLTASNTLADADGLGTIAYQWQTSPDGSTWTNISGATATTFTLTDTQVGKQIRVIASYTDGHGTSESKASPASGFIANVNDTPTGAVSIAGTATQNQVLTASNTLADVDGLGTIAYQWQTSPDGSTWTNISGATSATFTLTEIQVGKQVRAVASYTDGHGTAESVASSATTTIANVNDTPTGTVTIAGTATQNQILTASNTLADIDGLNTISYQWQSSTDSGSTWTNISGATTATFTLTDTQVGQQVRVTASYTDGHGTAESKSSTATTAVVNVNDAPTGTVTVAGTAVQNQTLAASNTLADGDGLGTITYQWQSSPNGSTWTNISGATSSTFTLTETQVGKQVRAVASYTDGHGTAENVISNVTTAVVNVNDAPTGTVTVAGTATQNQVLTASNTLADADGLGTIAYQWQSSADSGSTWTNIGGATAATFTLTETQVGKQVRVAASYIDGHGVAESVASTGTTAVVNVNDAPTGAVTITGTATQNQVLTASNALGDLDGLGTVSYQWQSSADSGSTWTNISGATASTYTLAEAQVGKLVRVTASYTDGHGTAESKSSTASAIVANINDTPTGTVTIAGTATQNQILTASNTLADVDGLG